jgi:hypothetical protein
MGLTPMQPYKFKKGDIISVSDKIYPDRAGMYEVVDVENKSSGQVVTIKIQETKTPPIKE